MRQPIIFAHNLPKSVSPLSTDLDRASLSSFMLSRRGTWSDGRGSWSRSCDKMSNECSPSIWMGYTAYLGG